MNLELLWEPGGLPAFDLPAGLAALYPGTLGFGAPRVFANFVETADGVVAIPSVDQSNQLIAAGNPADRFVMGLLRACADAVVVGSGTMAGSPGGMWTAEQAYPDAATLFRELRRARARPDEPEVVILSASGTVDPGHRVFEAGAVLITTDAGRASLRGRLPAASTLVSVGDRTAIDPGAALEALHARGHELVLHEGGPHVIGSFLAAGLVDEARAEARRMIDALKGAVALGTPIIGLEPSCLLTLRDEYPALLSGDAAKALAAHAQLFEEFVESERKAGRFDLPLVPMPDKTVLLHGHCHQKAFGTAGAAAAALMLIPELTVETFDSTCCGMAGSFGYEAEHHEMSLKIGELGVLPKMRAAAPDTLLAACGTSCRHQIADGARREARHIVRILDEASR